MTKTTHGGPRPGAGGIVKHIRLSPETAKKLRALLRATGGNAGKKAAERYIEALIAAAWERYDQEISQAVASAWEGEVLSPAPPEVSGGAPDAPPAAWPSAQAVSH